MRILTIKNSVICAALLAVSFSGCAQKGASSCNTVVACEKAVKVDNRDARIKQLQSDLSAAQNKPARVITKTVQGSSELYPPNAEPGKCYARVLTPAKYELRTEKMLKSEAGERLQVIPAKYGTKTEKLLVKEASERIIPVPATYRTVTEKILVSPASERIVTIPATYKTVTEKVLVKEASRGWKKGKGLVTKVNGTTGEIMCLVDTPAVYKTVTRQVIATPASTKTIPVPARYKAVTKRVVATPASTRTTPVPAQYKTVTVKTIVQPASTRRIPIPAKYQTVTKRVKVGSETLVWKEVKCRTVVH